MAHARERLVAIGRIVLAMPLAFIVPPASVAIVPGCGCSGGGAALPGLEVTVLDNQAGTTACLNTAVVARDGAYEEALIKVDTGAESCAYVGAYERPGTYTVEVNQSGRIVTLENVRVADGQCHVQKTKVTATLPPPNP
jgi:hypothetical protein